MPTVSGSPGALFLPVRLDVGSAEKDLKALGAAYNSILTGEKLDTAGFRAVNKDLTAIANKYERIFASLRGGGPDRAARGPRVRPVALPDDYTAITQRNATVASVAARARVKAARETAAAERSAAKEAEKFTREQTKAAKEAQRTAAAAGKIKQEYSGLSGTFKLLSTGSTELFTGLGAARSGNMFYALAAATRYAKNLGPALQGAAGAAGQTTGALTAMGGAGAAAGALSATGIGAIVVAAAAAAAVVGGLAWAFKELTVAVGTFGTQAAIELQTATAQFEGMLGSARAAREELDFLFDLGLTSTVQTRDLIDLDRALIAAGVEETELRRSLVSSVSTIGTALTLTAEQVSGALYQIKQAASSGIVRERDLISLGNFGIAFDEIVAGIAAVKGVDFNDVLKDLRSGGLTFDDLVAGLNYFAASQEDTAKKVQETYFGLQQQITDSLQTGFARAFSASGVAEGAASILRPIRDLLANFTEILKPTADAFYNLFATIGSGLADFQSGNGGKGVGFLTTIFGKLIPAAVNGAAVVVRVFMKTLAALKPVITVIWNNLQTFISGLFSTLKPLAQFLTGPLLVAVGTAIVSWAAFSLVLRAHGTVLRAVALGWEAVWAALNGDFDTAKRKLEEQLGLLQEMREGTFDTAKGLMDSFNGINAVDWNAIFDPETFTKAMDEVEQKSESIVRLAPELQDAIDSIADTMESYMGTASDFTKAWKGSGDGFTATADDILAASKSMAEVFTSTISDSAAESEWLKWLEDETNGLLELAKKRDAAAAELEKSQSKLDDMLKERDQFAASITSSFGSFMGSLSMGEKEVEKFQRFAGNGTAGWVRTVTKENTSVAQTLRDRLRRLKEFVANIRKAQAKGIDPEFVNSVIAAGPESGGEVAKQLANASAADIAEINSTMGEYRKLTKDFAKEQKGLYNAEAIMAQRSVVKGDKAALDEINAQADMLIKGIEEKFNTLDEFLLEEAKNHGETYVNGFMSKVKVMDDYFARQDAGAAASSGAFTFGAPTTDLVKTFGPVVGPWATPSVPSGPTVSLPTGQLTPQGMEMVSVPVVNVNATMTIDGDEFTPTVKKVVTSMNSEDSRKIAQRNLRR